MYDKKQMGDDRAICLHVMVRHSNAYCTASGDVYNNNSISEGHDNLMRASSLLLRSNLIYGQVKGTIALSTVHIDIVDDYNLRISCIYTTNHLTMESFIIGVHIPSF